MSKKGVSQVKADGGAQWEACETDSIASDGQEHAAGRKSSWYTLSKGSPATVTSLRARAHSADAASRDKAGGEKRKGRARGRVHNRRTSSLSADRRQQVQQRTVHSAKIIRRESSNYDSNATISNSEANDNASNDSNEDEKLRRAYEEHLGGIDSEDTDANQQHAFVPVELANRRAVGGKMYRMRSNGQARRNHRHSSPGSSSVAPVFYPTTPLRYRYKREFHGYKYQTHNRSIIAPPLSLRTTTNYDKVPVLFRCDSIPKRQISLLMTEESGYHSHTATSSKPHNSHIHGPATITADVGTGGTGTMTGTSRSKTFIKHSTQKPPRGPRRAQRHVRIQCNLLPSDAGTGTGTDQRQQQTVTFAATLVTTPVEKRSVAIQHDTLPPRSKLTIEMMNVDVSNSGTQTDIKTYAHRGDNTAELPNSNNNKHKLIDSSVQCSAIVSSVAVQSMQANIKNTATQSDPVAPPPPSRPIVEQKNAGTQSELVEKAKPQPVLKEKPGPKKTFRDASTEPWVVPVPVAAPAPAKVASPVRAAVVPPPAAKALAAVEPSELLFQQTAATPRVELPLEFDIPLNGPLPRPRPDIYFYQHEKEQELIRLRQKENNPPNNTRRIKSAGEQGPMPYNRHPDNRAIRRGMRRTPANLRYQGLYRILTS